MLLLHALLVGMVTAQAAYEYGAFPTAGGLIPRFLIDRSFPLAKRDGICDEGTHSCRDVGVDDQCCDNDSYCYISKEGDPKCCPIGSNCVEDSNCDSSSYFCTRTVTLNGSPTPREGCCGRSCPQTSQYLCPGDLGGNCCPFGADCIAGGSCVSAKSTSRTPLLTPVVEGCTTSQFKCADGAGCCDNWQHCTQVSGTGYCAAGNPTDTTISVVDNSSGSSGLSEGAKAGIGVGAVVGSSLIVGVMAWLCISKRRQRRERSASSRSGDGPSVHGGMTDITSVSRNRPRRGVTQDYFGPDAVPGPFTEPADSEVTTPGARLAVPTRPDGPGDITAPVEIDSTARDGNSRLTPMSSPSALQTPASETIEGRFELYGSDMPTPRRSSSILRAPPMGSAVDLSREDNSRNNVP